jgi:4-oxalocrotonate tautomerase
MPFVNIKLIPDGITTEQKERVIAGVTKVLQDELGKAPEATTVLIEAIESENWGKGGQSIAKRRAAS